MDSKKYDESVSEITEKINFIKEFNASRTPFWFSLLGLIIESIGPGIAIWFTLSNDFSFSFYKNLPNPNAGYLSLVCCLYLIYSLLSTTLFYFVKLHREDNFTYAMSFSFAIFTFILTSLFLDFDVWMVIVRFIISFVVLILGTLFGMLLTMIFRNHNLKIEEENKIMLQSYRNGDPIPDRKLVRIKRYEAYIKKQEEKKADIEQFKEQLNKEMSVTQKEEFVTENVLSKRDLKHREKMLKKEAKAKNKNKDFL